MIDGISFTQLGVAGFAVLIALYVLKLVIDGKLHTHSELTAKDKHIGDLMDANKRLTDAVDGANATMHRLLEIGRDDDGRHR